MATAERPTAPGALGEDQGDQAVDLLERVLAVPSPSGEEAECAQLLLEEMRARGLDARIDAVGNVIGTVGAEPGPSVLLLGHMDTAERFFPPAREGTVLRGRGAVDAKSALTAMLLAASAHAGARGRITVVGAVEEETSLSRGAHHLLRTMAPADYVIAGEPSGWDGVVIGYKGKVDAAFRAERPTAHPTHPGMKASEAAVAFFQTLVRELGPEVDHRRFDTPGATLVRITGDMAVAEAEAQCRLPPGFDTDAFVARLRAALPEGCLETYGRVPAVTSDRRDPVVGALSACIREVGGSPRHVRKTATSDLNVLAKVWQAPMVAYGPGDSDLDHTDGERIDIAEFLRGVEVLRRALGLLVPE